MRPHPTGALAMNRREILSLASALVLAQSSEAAQPTASSKIPESWHRAVTIPLWPGRPPGSDSYAPQTLPEDWSPVFLRNIAIPELHVFQSARPSGRALLVVPGGAYQFVSVVNEGVAVAERFNSVGVTVFVLTYRLPNEGWAARADVPLQDAQRAVRVIRSQASRFGIDTATLGVLGFSAGGHLAATLATQHALATYAPVDPADRLSPRPFAVGLVYPVVTMQAPWTHQLSRQLLLGTSPSDADIERRSAELHVGTATPPVFLVHALDDDAVPAENSLRMLAAMRAAKRPIEAHLLQEGGHAFGTGYPDTPAAQWIELFQSWWTRLRQNG
jgi:acetyl esterase/lipase